MLFCVQHFAGDSGPSTENPDPLQAEPTDAKKSRYAQKRRSDSPLASENVHHTGGTPPSINPPKMSRRSAAEALLSLQVTSSSSPPSTATMTTTSSACSGFYQNQVVANNETVTKPTTVMQTVTKTTVGETGGHYQFPPDIVQRLTYTALPPIQEIFGGRKV